MNEIDSEINIQEKKEADEKAEVKKEKNEKAEAEAEEIARRETEDKARREAEEEEAKRESEEEARREVEEKANQEADEKAKREAEKKAKQEADEKARREAEEEAKQEADEKAKREKEEKAKIEKEEKIDAIQKSLNIFLIKLKEKEKTLNKDDSKTSINEIRKNIISLQDYINININNYSFEHIENEFNNIERLYNDAIKLVELIDISNKKVKPEEGKKGEEEIEEGENQNDEVEEEKEIEKEIEEGENQNDEVEGEKEIEKEEGKQGEGEEGKLNKTEILNELENYKTNLFINNEENEEGEKQEKQEKQEKNEELIKEINELITTINNLTDDNIGKDIYITFIEIKNKYIKITEGQLTKENGEGQGQEKGENEYNIEEYKINAEKIIDEANKKITEANDFLYKIENDNDSITNIISSLFKEIIEILENTLKEILKSEETLNSFKENFKNIFESLLSNILGNLPTLINKTYLIRKIIALKIKYIIKRPFNEDAFKNIIKDLAYNDIRNIININNLISLINNIIDKIETKSDINKKELKDKIQNIINSTEKQERIFYIIKDKLIEKDFKISSEDSSKIREDFHEILETIKTSIEIKNKIDNYENAKNIAENDILEDLFPILEAEVNKKKSKKNESQHESQHENQVVVKDVNQEIENQEIESKDKSQEIESKDKSQEIEDLDNEIHISRNSGKTEKGGGVEGEEEDSQLNSSSDNNISNTSIKELPTNDINKLIEEINKKIEEANKLIDNNQEFDSIILNTLSKLEQNFTDEKIQDILNDVENKLEDKEYFHIFHTNDLSNYICIYYLGKYCKINNIKLNIIISERKGIRDIETEFDDDMFKDKNNNYIYNSSIYKKNIVFYQTYSIINKILNSFKESNEDSNEGNLKYEIYKSKEEELYNIYSLKNNFDETIFFKSIGNITINYNTINIKENSNEYYLNFIKYKNPDTKDYIVLPIIIDDTDINDIKNKYINNIYYNGEKTINFINFINKNKNNFIFINYKILIELNELILKKNNNSFSNIFNINISENELLKKIYNNYKDKNNKNFIFDEVIYLIIKILSSKNKLNDYFNVDDITISNISYDDKFFLYNNNNYKSLNLTNYNIISALKEEKITELINYNIFNN